MRIKLLTIILKHGISRIAYRTYNMIDKISSPTVSIITPCYNSSKTIAQTIESVRQQTFQDWEMLIVDDCSTDNSAQIIAEYQGQDSRIKYFKTDKPSGSPSLPRNIGIENSTGKWIAMLDSDDMWMPKKCQEQLDFALEDNYEFVYSDYEKMDWNGQRKERFVRVKERVTYKDILCVNSIPCCTAMVKRELIGDNRFKPVPIEDCCLWLDILRGGTVAHNTGKIHALYRVQKQSRSSNKLQMIAVRWRMLRNMERLGIVSSCYYLIHFLLQGLVKYIK